MVYRNIFASITLLVAACAQEGRPAAPRVANPTVSGVVCSEQSSADAGQQEGGTNCRARFDECSDGLSYELQCTGESCSCVVEGDELGHFRATESACDLDIDEMKVLCGWNLVDGEERIPAP